MGIRASRVEWTLAARWRPKVSMDALIILGGFALLALACLFIWKELYVPLD